jgi:hypothetical protein
MARISGRSKRGTRCRAAVPHGHWKTTTFTAGLRLGGLTAPMVIDGAMNGEAFLAYVHQLLVPTLIGLGLGPSEAETFWTELPHVGSGAAVWAGSSW